MFDLDGVLIDSEPLWEEVRRSYVAEHGGRWLADAQEHLLGMNTAEWARYLREELQVNQPPEEIASAVVAEMSRRYGAGLPFLPGALAALDRVGRQWRLALATSSPRVLIDVVVGSPGLAGRFQVTVSTDEVAHGKPAPDVYLEATRQLGVSGPCAAVEDSSNGLLSAAATGLAPVAVPRPSYPPSAAALDRAAVVLSGLDELTPAVVESLSPG